jgi:hypothetical protein
MFLAGILFSFDKPDFDSLKSSLGKQNSKLFHQGGLEDNTLEKTPNFIGTRFVNLSF